MPRPRPDFSMNLVHFTKDAPPVSAEMHKAEVQAIVPLTARARLFAILEAGQLKATRMPWTNRPAACFTECTWPSLLAHAQRYSPFGLGFRKEFVFAAGGGPAFYMPPHLLERQKQHVGAEAVPFDPDLYAFLTPFAPPYAPQSYKDQSWSGKKPIDFSHEREWRVPHSLPFVLDKVTFVIVETYEDMAQAPKKLKDAIGRDKWLIMANYRKIEELWPAHLL